MIEMKDSGIEWVGQIPSDWKGVVLRNILIRRDGGAWGNNTIDETDGTICLRIADFDYEKGVFKDTTEKELTKRNYSSSQIHKLKLRKGDILIEKSGGGEKTPVGRTVLFNKDYIALFANFMDRLRFDNERVLSIFAEYWLRAWYFCKSSPMYINQTTGIQNINLTLMLAKEKMFFPNIENQKFIADFLDAKCSEIDALTADIEKQIETLEAYKKSVITEAVTKGLNPDVEMKDSGIEWIGQIPKDWKIDKLKYHLHRTEPRNPGDAIVLSLYRELGVIPKDSRDDNYNVTSEDTSKYKFVRKGDFVVNKMKAWQGSVAVSDYEGIVSPAYYVYHFTDNVFMKRYLHYLLRGCYKDEFMRLSAGIRVGQWDLSSEALDNTLVVIPSYNEQEQICFYLDKKCFEIEAIIRIKQTQIGTLVDYKKSLIYEYVTGKKEVPNE